jgi:DNA excision repair protein ERCC-1
MDDDDFAFDEDLAALAQVVERASAPPKCTPIISPASTTNTSTTKIAQPTPRALHTRNTPSSIFVSPRQKGNPTLNYISAIPWEYSDIPADYVLGATTCALFLSLKYHRLHPEYIYTRTRALGQKYNLRILLTLVDIDGHEESLRELAKTGLMNNLTLMLCWSTREAARYLELYKSFEHAPATGIMVTRKEGWAERVVDVVTTVRGVNRADAVGLVGAFGSMRAAVNAEVEQLAAVGGWGEKKVERWYKVVREPFRLRNATKKVLEGQTRLEATIPIGRGTGAGLGARRDGKKNGGIVAITDIQQKRAAEDVWELGEDEEGEAMLIAAVEVEAGHSAAGSAREKDQIPESQKKPAEIRFE